MPAPFKIGSCHLADGASDAPPAAKGSKARAAPLNGTDDGPAYDGECWAFSSRYIKTTQAALQMALHAIQVCCTQAFSLNFVC